MEFCPEVAKKEIDAALSFFPKLIIIKVIIIVMVVMVVIVGVTAAGELRFKAGLIVILSIYNTELLQYGVYSKNGYNKKQKKSTQIDSSSNTESISAVIHVRMCLVSVKTVKCYK